MRIKIPRLLVTAWDYFGDVVNVPVFTMPRCPWHPQWHCASCGTVTDNKDWCDCTRYGNPSHQKLTLEGWKVLRIDILLAIMFCICVGYYYWTEGWYMALLGGVTFVFLAMCALWLF